MPSVGVAWYDSAMHFPRRFRITTLLIASAMIALAAGGARMWYDVQVAPQRADEAALAAPEMRGVVDRWSGPVATWRGGGRRVQHLWFDEAETFDAAAAHLGDLTAVESTFVLARQIMPHAAAAARGERDEVIEAWRRHPALRMVEIDASVRGAPMGGAVELYDQEDRAMLAKALPKVEIVWMEVH
ncbi:hypothetical protein [Lacipirellula sp.]|uniref:hypothetical protein n=1 Tax=Lacipirellula sp. TaxID=2691419 RepID=UPI003D0F3EAA